MKYKLYLNFHNPFEKLCKIVVCCEDIKHLFLRPCAVQDWGLKALEVTSYCLAKKYNSNAKVMFDLFEHTLKWLSEQGLVL